MTTEQDEDEQWEYWHDKANVDDTPKLPKSFKTLPGWKRVKVENTNLQYPGIAVKDMFVNKKTGTIIELQILTGGDSAGPWVSVSKNDDELEGECPDGFVEDYDECYKIITKFMEKYKGEEL